MVIYLYTVATKTKVMKKNCAKISQMGIMYSFLHPYILEWGISHHRVLNGGT